MEKKCVICGKICKNQQSYAGHIRWAHRTDKKTKKMFSEKMRETTLNYYSKQRGQKILIEKNCKFCEKYFSYETFENKRKEKLFCSRSCANNRKNSFTEEIKLKISKSVSKSIKNKWERGEYVVNTYFSSKEERRILEYLKSKFPNDQWASGGTLKISNELISRDMYTNKLKICIEYDGIWHFKDIHGQLLIKQRKDSLLNEWCKENEWKIIRISESWWHENYKNLDLIDTMINSTSNRIFMGSEYI